MISILAFIVVLGVLIFVHELGHFVTAKAVNIHVPRFSIGLGPKLWGFRRGETEYVISWLPLGGYVRMAGMDELEALEGGPEARAVGVGTTDAGLVSGDEAAGYDPERTFDSKSLPARALVISAGVIMNVLFAWLVFAGIAMLWGVRESPDAVVGDVVEELVPEGAAALLDVERGSRVVRVGDDEVRDWSDLQRALATAGPGPLVIAFDERPPIRITVPQRDSLRAALVTALEPSIVLDPVIGRVDEDSPAARAGIRAGDRIVGSGDEPVRSWQEFVAVVEGRPGEPVPLRIERGGRTLDVTVTPEPRPVEATGGALDVGRIGVASAARPSAAFPRDRLGPLAALGHGGAQTWQVTVMIVEFLVDLFRGEASPRDVGGPILIYQLSGEVVRIGMEAFLNFMALFSINLAILNLLPIPILDGGQLVFLGLEAVRGRALSYEQRVRLSQVGLVIIVAIMVWALANDVLRLFGV